MNRRAHSPLVPGSVFAATFFRIALVAALLTGLSATRLHAQSANSLYKSGQSAEARQDYDAAFDFFQKANAKNPKDLSYRTALYRVRQTASSTHLSKGQKLLQSGDQQGALAEFLHAAAIDPGNEAAQQAITHLRQKGGLTGSESEAAVPEPSSDQLEINSISAPIDLRPLSNEPLTLHMTEDAKVIYQAIGKAAGVNVLFDPDYNSKRIQVDLNNVSLLDALRIVGTMSSTFWRPVTANTLFVAQNTRIKRTELDEQAVQTFYLSNAWQQNDLNDVQTALRNVLTTAKIYGVASQNAIVMRGTPDELLLAQKLINDLDKARAEVVVDIAVMEVSKNWERNLGISWPSSIGVALQSPDSTSSSSGSSSGSSTTTVSPTLYDLAHLKATNFAVSVGSATLNLLLSDSNTKILQSPRIRATGDQKATMKIGSRIPVATGSYQTGAATAVVSSLVNTQFQYQDVGVNIEMTPTIHFDHDVTLKIKIEVTSHSGDVTISGVTEPIISQRVVDQVIRLREGEASILGGIQDNEEQQSSSGIPGLGSIPILKYVFGSKDRKTQNDEIVFVVVPHIVRSQELGDSNLRAIDTGSGQSIDLRHNSDSNTGPASAPAPAVRPIALQNSQIGTAPGQTAEAAAPALMSQLTAAAQNPPSPVPPPRYTPPPVPPPAQAPAPATAPASAPAPTSAASFTFNPPAAPPTAGATFQVPVFLSGAEDIASVPIQVQYDPARITLVNVAAGDLLNRDGQAVALIHRDDGPGNVTVVAARPPGAAGISGAGVVCILTFQAKSAGSTVLTMTRAGAVNSKQQQVQATAGRVDLVVK